MRPFDIALGTVRSFRGRPAMAGRALRRPLVLSGESEALTALHGDLGAAMRRWGMKAGDRFTPHVTLLYGPDLVPGLPVPPIRARVGSFALIHSEVGLGRYHVLGEWRLH